jgi:tetratricopeptide (TPR) repeat protein
VRAKIGTEDEALEWYDRALQVEPNHVIANTNRVAPLLRERRFAEARSYVEAALRGKGEPEHRARALDQMGQILCDEDGEYKKALRYHAEAVELAPTEVQFQCNHIISLVQADDMHGLRKYWGRYGSFLSRQTTPEAQKICDLVPPYLKPLSDPRECIGMAEAFSKLFGWNAVKHFIREAWSLGYKVPDDAKPGFCAEAGMMAAQAGDHELALRFFTKGEAYEEPGGPLSLNCAAALADLGRTDEALAKSSQRTSLASAFWAKPTMALSSSSRSKPKSCRCRMVSTITCAIAFLL